MISWQSNPQFEFFLQEVCQARCLWSIAIVDCKQPAIVAMVHWDLHEEVLVIDKICNFKIEMASLKNKGRHHNTQWPYNIGDIQGIVQDLIPPILIWNFCPQNLSINKWNNQAAWKLSTEMHSNLQGPYMWPNEKWLKHCVLHEDQEVAALHSLDLVMLFPKSLLTLVFLALQAAM